jgi:hypothetical protein
MRFLLGVRSLACDAKRSGIEKPGRKERKEGLVHNWVQSIEHKTKKGAR